MSAGTQIGGTLPARASGIHSHVEPFYFGRNGRLFGIYHPAQRNRRDHGLLIAPPLFNEGIRAHFALKQIADRTAAAGFDVLRFDFSGLGNSPLKSTEGNPAAWETDILEAASELAALSGSATRSVVAVRFAANLVNALVQRGDVARVVLWDPVLSGEQWLDELYKAHERLPQRIRSHLDHNPPTQFSGHPVANDFLDAVQSRALVQHLPAEVSAVISRHYPYRESLQRVTRQIDHVDADCGWRTHLSSILYYPDLVAAICKRLT